MTVVVSATKRSWFLCRPGASTRPKLAPCPKLAFLYAPQCKCTTRWLMLQNSVACRSAPSRRGTAVVAKWDSAAPARASFADRRAQRSGAPRSVVCAAAAASAASCGDEAVRVKMPPNAFLDLCCHALLFKILLLYLRGRSKYGILVTSSLCRASRRSRRRASSATGGSRSLPCSLGAPREGCLLGSQSVPLFDSTSKSAPDLH